MWQPEGLTGLWGDSQVCVSPACNDKRSAARACPCPCPGLCGLCLVSLCTLLPRLEEGPCFIPQPDRQVLPMGGEREQSEASGDLGGDSGQERLVVKPQGPRAIRACLDIQGGGLV